MLDEFLNHEGRITTQGVDCRTLDGTTVLVTGASGVIGFGIIAALRTLARDGLRLRIITTFQRALDGPFEAVLDDPCFRVIRGDLTDHAFRSRLPSADVVFHCAGYGQPGKFAADPLKTLRVNTETTFDLLERLPGGGRLLFASSTEVYAGLTPGTAFNEETIGISGPDHPRACYIEGKRCGEAACHTAFASGVKAIAVRLGQTYGPGVRPGDSRALYAFIESALRNGRIELQDGGEATRSYCYNADAARMMLQVVCSGTKPLYNVGGVKPIRIYDVAKQVATMLGVPMSCRPTQKPLAGAPESVILDMQRFAAEFGPLQYVDFSDGLRRTIEWLKLIS